MNILQIPEFRELQLHIRIFGIILDIKERGNTTLVVLFVVFGISVLVSFIHSPGQVFLIYFIVKII